jgi:hypothetical protein
MNPERSTAGARPANSISASLQFHSVRDFGATGFREVTLSVYNGDTVMSEYVIYHIWKSDMAFCSSLFYLTKPPALSATAVLLNERPDNERTDIWLRLRTAASPVSVAPSRSSQFMLGTDFTYEDLRFWLPFSDARAEVVAAKTVASGRAVVLQLRDRSAEQTLRMVTIVLDVRSGMPIRMEWADAAGHVHKTYTAAGLRRLQSVWTPSEITVTRPLESYRSVMTLRRAAHNIPIADDLFMPEALTRLSEPLFSRWRRDAVVVA